MQYNKLQRRFWVWKVSSDRRQSRYSLSPGSLHCSCRRCRCRCCRPDSHLDSPGLLVLLPAFPCSSQCLQNLIFFLKLNILITKKHLTENFKFHEISPRKSFVRPSGVWRCFQIARFLNIFIPLRGWQIAPFLQVSNDNYSLHLMDFNPFEMFCIAKVELILRPLNHWSLVMWHNVYFSRFAVISYKFRTTRNPLLQEVISMSQVFHFHFSAVLLICCLENRYIGYCTTVFSTDMTNVVFV